VPPPRKKVLVVSPDVPFPLDRSGRRRVWELCRALKGRCAFRLAAFAPRALAQRPLEAEALKLRLGEVFEGARLVPWDGPEEDLWFRHGDPGVREGASFARMGEAIQAEILDWSPDLVQIEHVQLASCRRFVWGPPVVLDEYDLGWIDLRHRLWERRGDGAAAPLLERAAGWARLRWDYHRLGRTFQGVVTAGAADLDWWRAWGPADVPSEYVPTGVDAARFPPRREAASRPEVLFVGHYAHPPNAEAARYFLSRVWPRVADASPEARVTFAGGAPPAWLLAARSGRVRVPGHVADLAPLYRAARVFAAPLRLGRGIKAKVAEAFAAGVPVVASPEAMDGFPSEARALVRLAPDAPAFALETLNLLNNTRLRSETSTRARRWVEQNLSWSVCADRLHRFYQLVWKDAPFLAPV
jgi:polysaccharide biosynthesis protein PslH